MHIDLSHKPKSPSESFSVHNIPFKKRSSRRWVGLVIILFITLITVGLYLMFKLKMNSQLASLENMQLSPTVTPTIAPILPKNITINIDSEAEGAKTVDINFLAPDDWEIAEVKRGESSCFSTIIASKDLLSTITLNHICDGWAAEYSEWPADASIVMKKDSLGNDGPNTKYRLRQFMMKEGAYKYFDAITEAKRPFDPDSDQVMDAVIIGYDSENKDQNTFFIPVNIVARYAGDESNLDSSLKMIDSVVASMSLR